MSSSAPKATKSLVTRMLIDYPLLLPAASFFAPILNNQSTESASNLPPNNSKQTIKIHGYLSSKLHYQGYITVPGDRSNQSNSENDTQIRIELITASTVTGLSLLTVDSTLQSITLSSQSSGALMLGVEPHIHQLLLTHQSMLDSRFNQAKDVHAFLADSIDILSRLLHQPAGKSIASTSTWLPASFYAQIVNELSTIGWSNVQSIDHDCDSISFVDSNHSINQLTPSVLNIQLSDNYPVSPPIIQTALPIPFEINWKPPNRTSGSFNHQAQQQSVQSIDCSSLVEIYTAWCRLVQSLQPFFDVLRDFDTNCLILDPDPPVSHVTYRRIGVAPSVSMHVVIDCYNPYEIPIIRWLGPDHRIAPFQHALASKAQTWNRAINQSTNQPITPRANLETILGISFPQPKSTSSVDANPLNVECAICYHYSLHGAAPVIVCAQEKCARCYHASCLLAWLQKDFSTATVFDRVIGKCINCQETISVNQSAAVT